MRKITDSIFFRSNQTRLVTYGLVVLILINITLFYKLIRIKKLELMQLQEDVNTVIKLPNSNNLLKPLESPVSKFYKQLPDSRQINTILAFIFKLAAEKKLTIDTINYQLEEQAEVSFSIYKIQAPVAGTYLDLMKFVQRVLDIYPSIALTNLSMSRENSQSNLVDAEIELSVYLKKD